MNKCVQQMSIGIDWAWHLAFIEAIKASSESKGVLHAISVQNLEENIVGGYGLADHKIVRSTYEYIHSLV